MHVYNKYHHRHRQLRDPHELDNAITVEVISFHGELQPLKLPKDLRSDEVS